jgi:[ribosomal protein S5]-alanine N-acetyltransferase
MPIITDRLELRTYALDDIPRIHEILYGNAEARVLTGGVSTLAETRATIAGYIGRQERDGYTFWAVVERASGELVGEAGLKPLEDKGPEVEIGYAFGPPWWGRGYATEAGRAILDVAFGTLGLERVVAVTADDNVGSQRVIAKLGFTPAGRRDVYGANLLYYTLDRA